MKGRNRFENLAKKLLPMILQDLSANLGSFKQGPRRRRMGRNVDFELLYHAQPIRCESTLKRGIIPYHSRDGPSARHSIRQHRIITTASEK